MKFLTDENIHSGLSLFLKKAGHDVKLPPKTVSDKQVFKIAVEEKRILLTRDSDFLDSSFTSKNHSGIVLIRISAGDLKSQISSISKLLLQYNEIDNEEFVLISSDKFEPAEDFLTPA